MLSEAIGLWRVRRSRNSPTPSSARPRPIDSANWVGMFPGNALDITVEGELRLRRQRRHSAEVDGRVAYYQRQDLWRSASFSHGTEAGAGAIGRRG
jgi:hypothetical protein